ncbi:MAG: ABC transporter permease [Candidatus Pacebacteria bacterium]|nr:ABC transporter permease [Candidatus Paceibacterota bacterium]MBP9715639.1 ABC transporter permease [Candidatus Paceibacterota bacterium]
MLDKQLKFNELITLSFRSFRTKPQRAFLTIMGMSVGIATVLLLVSLGYGLQYILIGKLVTTEDSLITMEVSYPTESNILIKKSFIDELRSSPDVAEVSPVAEFPGEISAEGTSGLIVNTQIIEPSYFRLAGLTPNIGKVLDVNTKGTIVSSQTLSALGLPIEPTLLQKPFTLKMSYQDEKVDLAEEESFFVETLPLQGVVVDENMQPTSMVYSTIFPRDPPFYRKALVKAKDIDTLEGLRDKLISQGLLVSARIDLVTQARKITNIITMVLGVFGVTALVVSAIGMFNTMLVAFLERIYEVGILKSIGATDYDVRNLFLVEASFMGLLGGVGGVTIGFGLGQLFNFLLSAVAKRFGGESLELFVVPFWFVLLIMGFSILIGFVSGWWPAHRAAGLSPKEAFTRK